LAACGDWPEIAEILIRNGAKVRDTENRITPLHCASSNGHLGMVELLIENGADPKDINKDDSTSLHVAAKNGRLGVVKYFIDVKSIDVNIADKTSDKPLHAAAFHRKLDVVEFLVEKNANINAVNELGATPLLFAALVYNREVFKFLLNKGAKVIDTSDNKTLIGRLNFSVLHIAAAYGDMKIIEDLIDRGVDKDIGRDVSLTPLHVAAFFGRSETMKYLIGRGADTEACVKLHNIISVLKDAAGDNDWGIPSVVKAVMKCNNISSYFTSFIKITPGFIYGLLNRSDKVLFSKRRTGMFSRSIENFIFNISFIRKKVDNIKMYVEQGENQGLNLDVEEAFLGFGINARDDDGNTSLHLAVTEGVVDQVRFLINAGADPNIQDNNKKSPLDLAKEKVTQDPENDDLKEIVDILNQQIQSPSISQPGSPLPETTGGTMITLKLVSVSLLFLFFLFFFFYFFCLSHIIRN
jgi:ankyrin repeat protein